MPAFRRQENVAQLTLPLFLQFDDYIAWNQYHGSSSRHHHVLCWFIYTAGWCRDRYHVHRGQVVCTPNRSIALFFLSVTMRQVLTVFSLGISGLLDAPWASLLLQSEVEEVQDFLQ
jgi:hypothetical protein